MRKNQNKAAPSREASTRSRLLEASLRRSVGALALERLWRLATALATLALAFLTLSWLGLWRAAPVEARVAGVALFGFCGLFLIAKEIARGWPGRRAALQRLDAATDGSLRPAASLDDALAKQNDDPATTALWKLHRQRLEAALAQTPIAAPDPQTPRRDPYALRAFALVAAIAAAFIAGDEKGARLRAAFDWRGGRLMGETARIDAWFEPPAYTGRPAIMLASESGHVDVPVGAILHLRPSTSRVSVEGGLAVSERAESKENNYALRGPARLSLPDGRDFEIGAIADQPPDIALTDKIRINARGSMTFSYRAVDDYGVTGVDAIFSSASNGRRALYEPPRIALAAPINDGETKATVDLSDNPYAGAPLTLRLVAKDGAGNEGASQAIEMILPQRKFTKPLARALVEQRRILALDPQARATVRAALDALGLAPEIFDTPSSVYLGLRAARRGLDGKRSDDELRGVVDLLWAMALSIEDGGASSAEQQLRAAEQALREAMAKGESEEEIARRSQELRAALDRFLEQLGVRPHAPDAPRENAGDDGDVTPNDLQAMLDEIDKALKDGDTAQAQQLLDELQDIMENVQTPQQSGAADAARQRAAMQALREIDQIAREEQRLRDETFQEMKKESDDAEAHGGKSRSGAEPRDARNRQQALRQRLEKQQDALRGAGGEAAEELDDARHAMKEAEDALGGQGDGREGAVDAQGRAVDALRKGADKLAQQMRGEGEDGQAEGQNGRRSRGHARGGKGRDPLGRSSGGQHATRDKYDPLGLPPAQRAHRVQEELRRRLGQPERPAEELDYLQRLLRR